MDTIIVATDFSAPALNAVNYAASLARYLNTRLVLVNAFGVPVSGDPQVSVDLGVISDASIKALEEIKRGLIAGSYDFGIDCYSAMGTARSVIDEACSRYDAEMIVLGMTGEAGKIKEHIMGSTALSVGRSFSIPVLIVPEGASYKRIRHISFACDMDKMSESTLVYSARYFATLFDAELEIVTVEKAGGDVKWHKPEGYSFIDKKLSNIKHKQVTLKEDDVNTALEYYFKFHSTDLVIVNPQKHTLFGRLFGGSVTRHLAFHSSVPLLTIH